MNKKTPAQFKQSIRITESESVAKALRKHSELKRKRRMAGAFFIAFVFCLSYIIVSFIYLFTHSSL